MDSNLTSRRSRRRIFWGVVLIAIGSGFLLSRFGFMDTIPFDRMWPAIILVFGVARMMDDDRAHGISSGVGYVLLGLWFFACNERWYGLRYRTAWPILLMISGLQLVLRAILEAGRRKEERHA